MASCCCAGLPVERWGARLCAVAFYGLGIHIGVPRTQNAQGHLLGHVRDLGLRSDDPNVRIYQTHERQTFHTDSADVVGLLCLQTAKRGGLSALVSSITLYNELRARRPDLARRLFAPFATDRRGEVPPGEKPYFTIPVFNWYEGELSAIYQRQYIDSAQRFADAPRLTAEDIEALDLLDALTDDPALHLTMTLERGDMQFVHNHTLLHDRTAFEDHPEPARRRHLLRLWLSPESARPLPPVFAQRYGSVVPGASGGVRRRGGRGRDAAPRRVGILAPSPRSHLRQKADSIEPGDRGFVRLTAQSTGDTVALSEKGVSKSLSSVSQSLQFATQGIILVDSLTALRRPR